jgi:NADH-quinone oxidoreductase subunit L
MPAHPAMAELAEDFHGPLGMAAHGLVTLPFWLALAGVVTAWLFYLSRRRRCRRPSTARSGRCVVVLENKYYMDWFNEHVLAGGARCSARACGRAATRA